MILFTVDQQYSQALARAVRLMHGSELTLSEEQSPVILHPIGGRIEVSVLTKKAEIRLRWALKCENISFTESEEQPILIFMGMDELDQIIDLYDELNMDLYPIMPFGKGVGIIATTSRLADHLKSALDEHGVCYQEKPYNPEAD